MEGRAWQNRGICVSVATRQSEKVCKTGTQRHRCPEPPLPPAHPKGRPVPAQTPPAQSRTSRHSPSAQHSLLLLNCLCQAFCPRDKEANKHTIFPELQQNKYLFRQMRDERIHPQETLRHSPFSAI